MRVHHLNCATMCPFGARLVNGPGHGLFESGKLVCHVLLVETERDGLVLVDSGFGTGDIADRRRFHSGFVALVRPRFDPSETAIERVRALGHQPEDVRHIVVTHLDLDHAGGLADFPWATVHVHKREHEAASSPRTARDRMRYIGAQWAHGPKWALHDDASGDDWFGLRAIRRLDGLSADFALVPLFGHSRGHSGVAVKASGGWLLHAGDAYFFHREIETPPYCSPGLSVFQSFVERDREARLENQARLREIHARHSSEITVFSAHSVVELNRLAGADVTADKRVA